MLLISKGCYTFQFFRLYLGIIVLFYSISLSFSQCLQPVILFSTVCDVYSIYHVYSTIKFFPFSIAFSYLSPNVGPSYERPPVLRDHFGRAEGVVSQDRDHCSSSNSSHSMGTWMQV